MGTRPKLADTPRPLNCGWQARAHDRAPIEHKESVSERKDAKVREERPSVARHRHVSLQ